MSLESKEVLREIRKRMDQVKEDHLIISEEIMHIILQEVEDLYGEK